MVMIRSRSLMNADKALSKVVLPEPVPPEIKTLRRPSTTASSSLDISGVRLPNSTSRSMPMGVRENFRIETKGPSTAKGGMMALIREPSARRASTMGAEFINPPAHGADDLVDDAHQMAGVLKLDIGHFQPPSPLHIDCVVGVDQDVVDRVVLEQGFQGAEAQNFIEQIVDQPIGLKRSEEPLFLGQQVDHGATNFEPQRLARRSVQEREVEDFQQPGVEARLQRGGAFDRGIGGLRRGAIRPGV